MISMNARVGAPNGLHARPAALLVAAAEESGADITLRRGEASADAASILEVLMLGAEHGDEVELTAADETDRPALERLAQVIEKGEA